VDIQLSLHLFGGLPGGLLESAFPSLAILANSIVFHSVDVLIPLSPILQCPVCRRFVLFLGWVFCHVGCVPWYFGAFSSLPFGLCSLFCWWIYIFWSLLLFYRNWFFHIMSFKHPAILEALSIWFFTSDLDGRLFLPLSIWRTSPVLLFRR